MNSYHRIDLPVATGDDLRAAVLEGLASDPPALPCRFLYDEVGSRLFEAICVTEAYYPTRCEREILAARAGDLAARFPGHALVELGSGNAEKTALLLEAWPAPARYVPIDIDPAVLDRGAERLLGTVPDLAVLAVAGEYQPGLERAMEELHGPALVLFLGGNVGNFTRAAAADFLASVRAHLAPGDGVLLGADLRKDAAVLEEAYDDPAGVTAAFNLNLLERVRRELGAEVDPRGFRHVAEYDVTEGVVRMYLEARGAQVVRVEDQAFEFADGARLHTEDSVKYDRAELEALAVAAGLELDQHWTDAGDRYSLNLLRCR